MGLSKYIFENLMGWKIVGSFDPKIKKSVIIVVPHTSWHDFYIGVFTRKITGIQINFIAKKELFRWPFGGYFKWMGGVSLDRTPGQKKVEAIAEIFNQKEEFRLAMAPEGTRQKVEAWKTGFYYIALKAKVPIICVAFGYKTKSVIVHKPFSPTGNLIPDLKILSEKFAGVVGKKPALS